MPLIPQESKTITYERPVFISQAIQHQRITHFVHQLTVFLSLIEASTIIEHRSIMTLRLIAVGPI